MSFFGRGLYPSEPNFTGLFRLIDDCYAHQNSDGSYQQGLQRHVPRHVPTFTPKFDVKETENNYELHGELPGIEKKDVQIEFTDPQTIVVRGRVERSYTAGTPPAGLLEKKPDEMSGAITEGGNGDDAVVVDREEHDTASNKSFQATVEDANEDGKTTTTTTGGTGAQATPSTTTTVDKKQQGNKPAAPAAKYWVSERSVGEFSRSFAFPTRVASENVSASLENGILTVVVPKAKKHESRRIAIN
ncbi:HSP20-like chaperone [Biscogniauxia marginata]|nr:HSP20-like chaperone [Biscogniauxia marginata]